MAEVGTVYVSVMPQGKGFAAAMDKQAQAAGKSSGKGFNLSFGAIVGGTALGNIAAKAFSGVSSAISGSLGAAISRVDTLNNFPKVMQNLGYGADEAQSSINKLSDGIDGLPTSLDGIVSMTQQLAPLCGGLDQATSLSLALNNMMLAGGASVADQNRAMVQYTQALSKGKFELNDWRTLQEVMPAQLNQVASALLGAGRNSTDLYEALKNGTVSMDDFNGAILRLNEEGVNGFSSFAEQAGISTQSIGTAMENVQNRVSKSVGKVIDHIGQANIAGAINSFTSQFGAIADRVNEVWDGMMSTIDFEGFRSAFDTIGSALSDVFSEGDQAATFGQQLGSAINGLIPVVRMAGGVIVAGANALKFFMDNASWLIPVLAALFAAFKLAPLISTGASFLSSFGSAAAVATPKVSANAAQMIQMGVAALALGAGIALACAGVFLLVQAAVQLSESGPMAAVALVGLVAVIGGFVAVMAIAGPALTAGAVGMVAFGAAVLMVGAGVMLACAGITLLSGALPALSAYGMSASASIVALGGSMLVAAPGALALGAALLVAGAGAVVAGAGMMLLGAGSLVAGAGLLLCTAPSMLLGPMLMLAGAGAMVLGTSLMVVAASSVMALPGLLALAAGIGGVSLALGLAVPSFMGLSGALGGCAGALGGCAASMTVIVASCRMASSSSAQASAGYNAMGSAAQSASSRIASAGSRISSAQSDLAFRIQAANSRIQSSFNNMRLHIPSPTLGKMPHFSLSGKFDLEAGTVPTINVNWYAKGGVFNRPSVIGVGEAGTEVAYSADKLLDRFESVATKGSGEGWQEACALLYEILQAIPRLSQRDLQREIRRTANA